MNYTKNFSDFKKFNLLKEELEPESKAQPVKKTTKEGDEIVGGKDEFEVKASKAGKKKLRLDYTKKAKEPYWQGSNYDTEWIPWVDDAMKDDETKAKIIKYLDEYTGQDANTVKQILKRERALEAKGKGTLQAAIQKLATDRKIGPFHTIIKKAITRVTGKDIDKLDIKPPPKLAPTLEPEKPKPQMVKIEPQKTEDTGIQLVGGDSGYRKGKTGDLTSSDDAGRAGESGGIYKGEQEKSEQLYKKKGANKFENLMTLIYPTFETEQSQLGSVSLIGDSVRGGKTRLKLNINRPKRYEENMYIYIYHMRRDKDYPWSMYHVALPSGVKQKEVILSTPKADNMTYKVIFSTKKFKFAVKDQEEDLAAKKRVSIFTVTQAETFFDELVSSIRDFDKQPYDGPVYSIDTLKVDIVESGRQGREELSEEQKKQIEVATEGENVYDKLFGLKLPYQEVGFGGNEKRLVETIELVTENKRGKTKVVRRDEPMKKGQRNYALRFTLRKSCYLTVITYLKEDSKPVSVFESPKLGPGQIIYPKDGYFAINDEEGKNNTEIRFLFLASLEKLSYEDDNGYMSEANCQELIRSITEDVILPYDQTEGNPSISALRMRRKLV